ncbi:hypothetical protein NM208_g13147 [Fusarium decemcellulare]|uniref:Uncharacterized protein n=1 Tax=Fusarium decemcellulare TaxID=57161 RepID=A0ACC1RLJ8_9HYPO|nr:hypothetical protein NM208_g13147 [Fusarium decemcellulare]
MASLSSRNPYRFTPPLPFRCDNTSYRPLLFSQRPRAHCPEPLDLSRLATLKHRDERFVINTFSSEMLFSGRESAQFEAQMPPNSSEYEEMLASNADEEVSETTPLLGLQSPVYSSSSAESLLWMAQRPPRVARSQNEEQRPPVRSYGSTMRLSKDEETLLYAREQEELDYRETCEDVCFVVAGMVIVSFLCLAMLVLLSSLGWWLSGGVNARRF